MSGETPSRPAPVSPLAEARGLLAAFIVIVAIVVLGLTNPSQPTGWLRIQHIDELRVVEVLQLYLSGPSCSALLQTARGSVDGQYARIEISQIGTFEIQSRLGGPFTVRPLTAVNDADGCRFNPRYVGPTS